MGITEKQGLAQAAVLETDAFASLLNKEFKPKTEQAQEAVISAVRTLAEQALANTNIISADAYRTVEGMIAEIDRKLSEQVNRIIHHEDFQRLEGSWRGLHYLVSNTETDEMLKIQILNINKKELGRTLQRHKGILWDQSPIFKKVYEAEYGQFGGEPFGCLVGDYYFDHNPQDVALLTEMSKISASVRLPLESGVLSPC